MDRSAPSDTSDIVCVQIRLKHEANPYREVVKRKTRGHECVELPEHGFMFRRKRRPPLARPATAQEDEHELVTADHAAVADQHVFGSPVPAAPTPPSGSRITQDHDAHDALISNPSNDEAVASKAYTPATAAAAAAAQQEEEPQVQQQGPQEEQQQDKQSNDQEGVQEPQQQTELKEQQQTEEPQDQERMPDDFTMPADELLYNVQWALTSELHKARKLAPEQVTTAVESITQSFRAALQVPTLLTPTSYTVLPYQLDKLKKSLVDKRDKLLEEEAAWQALEAKYAVLTGAPANQGGEAAGADGDEPGTSMMEVDSHGNPSSSGAGAAATAAPDESCGAGAGGEGSKPGSTAAVAVGTGADASKADAGLDTSPGLMVGSAATAAAALECRGRLQGAGEDEDAPGLLVCTQTAAVRSMGLQVEALVGLVSKVEQLVARAEATARTLQVDFHHETFKHFSHVNSPAYLIKSIIHPRSASD